MVFICKPLQRLHPEDQKQEIEDRICELLFNALCLGFGALLPMWGIAISICSSIEKSLTIDIFFKEEHRKNFQTAFLLGMSLELFGILMER